ncbi:MAG: SWIM zinc finger family protein [Desulfurococcales archaeon]|nr:SWIM zinc finger family protein [Desulfurococcales archaeon]MCE4604969.1 SWIM zinc finger family protein [Desulfurococcales archaeon]
MAGSLQIDYLIDRFTSEVIGKRAKSIALSGRLVMIHESPEILVYLGEREDYVIVDKRYCSCQGFLMRLAKPEDGVGCSHVKAARMSDRRVRVKNLGPDEVETVVWEALTGGFTMSLRRKIYGRG